MGRTLSINNSYSVVPGINAGAAASEKNPISGVFGSGQIKVYTSSGSFVVPDGCTRVRARVWGAGSGAGVAGGTSSFGTHISATGGGNTGATPGAGTGGDINNSGGATNGYGGGGAGSVVGPGNSASGTGGDRQTSTQSPGISGTAGFIGVAGRGGGAGTSTGPGEGGHSASGQIYNFPIDYFGAGSGGGSGGVGSSIYSPGGAGWNGGGGGAMGGNGSSGGAGGFPGGGQGGSGTVNAGAGGGFAIKDISGLTPGASIAVTVGAPGGQGGRGLVIVEW